MQLKKRVVFSGLGLLLVTHLSLPGDIKVKVTCPKWKGQLLLYFCKVLIILLEATLQNLVLESLSSARCLSEPNTQN